MTEPEKKESPSSEMIIVIGSIIVFVSIVVVFIVGVVLFLRR